MNFKVGDMVRWRSQAQGSAATKVGEIVEVVNPGQRPDREKFDKLYRGSGCGYGRAETSFVVMVGNKPYWPRASLLEPLGPSQLEKAKGLLQRIGNVLATSDADFMPITVAERDGLLAEIRDVIRG